MVPYILAGALFLASAKSSDLLHLIKPLAKCPRPVLVNINLSHRIDRGVFRRTYMHCRHQYKKSPCLLKLVQPQLGAFHAVCGQAQASVKNGIEPEILDDEIEAAPDDSTFQPNCSAEIFEPYRSEDWATFQTFPITVTYRHDFCEALQIEP